MRLLARCTFYAVWAWCLEVAAAPLVLGADSITGRATWYSTGPGAGQAAAGSELRAALGPGWRGSVVQVCADGCVTVTLSDWCACPGPRIVDLSDEDFAQLAPLPVGVIAVRVILGPTVTLPPTDAPLEVAGRALRLPL